MQKGIACISSTEKTQNYALESPVQFMKDRRGLVGLSHYFAQYAVKKTIAECFLGYACRQYENSCEEVLNLFSIAIGKICITAVKKQLIPINQCNYRMEASITIC